MNLLELKSRYNVTRAWRDLGLPGEPGRTCRSPFPALHKHGDANPSFSIFDDGNRWEDFATGDGGDVLDLIVKARGCQTAEAIRFIEQQLGITRTDHRPGPDAKLRPKIPPLRSGDDGELRELCDRRGFGMESLRLAQRRGFLHFTELFGHAAWCLTDARRELYEFRRLDGAKWPAYGRLSERKAHCLGTGKSWPIGTLESDRFERVVWCEGAPDFLAALSLIVLEQKTHLVAPVAVLGASNHRLAPEALAHFTAKHVCIFPHLDDAGRKAVREWARQLKGAWAARVTAFNLSGLVCVDGRDGKDLCDLLRIHPDCFDSAEGRKFWEVMP